MLLANTDLQLTLDLIGIFAFALSGGLVAVERRLDIIGVLVLAWAAGLGGGITRDLLLGIHPPLGIADWRLVLTAQAAGVYVFFRHPRYGRIHRVVRVLDAAGLALFTVAGTLKALGHDASVTAAITIGVITACGGGVLRDLLAGQVPELLRRELYAVPSLVGAAGIVLAARTGLLGPVVVWAAVLCVFVLRMAALRFRLHAPRPRTGDDR